jgi:hypothetical protein
MKRETSVGVGDGTRDDETGMLVEEVIADDECGAPPLLLVA